MFAEDGIDPLDKKLSRRPIVEDRHQDCQWKQGRKFRLEITIGGAGIRLRGGHDGSSLVRVDFGRQSICRCKSACQVRLNFSLAGGGRD